jgi:nitroreductase
MDAYRAIITKRDRREYDPRPIGDEARRRILQAGRMAGSSSNRQPIRLIVLSDRSALEALVPAGPGTRAMLSAPLSIGIALQDGGTGFEVGRVAQNMMVAAWAEGIASCPQGIRDQDIARSALKLPAEFTLPMCLAFGHPAPPAAPRESRPRLPLEEMVHYGTW